MEFTILGPLEVRLDGKAANLGGPKQRAVLAFLLLNANEVVSRDRLIAGLWGERPPASAGRSLDSYVSRLRAQLGANRIERRSPGYSLRVEPGELDLERFEGKLAQGREALSTGNADVAAGLLSEALALWHGPALADLLYEPFAGHEASRLESRRLLAVETRMEAELERGQGPGLLADIERLVAENPFSERLLGQLMLALYQSGRPSDALAAFQAGRRRLVDELGLEPSPQLRELERRILDHDPGLAVPPRARRAMPRGRGRAGLVVAAGAVLVVVATVLAIAVTAGSGDGAGIVVLGPGGRGVPGITAAPTAMAADATSVWLAQPDGSAIVGVDRKTRRVDQRIPVEGSPATIAVGGGAVWTASIPGDTVIRIDPATGARTQTIGLGGAQIAAVAYGHGTVWVADASDRELIGIDAGTGTVARTFELLVKPSAVAVGEGGIWIADYSAGLVTEIAADTGATLATVRVGNGPAALALGDGAVWVANSLDSTVSRVDVAIGSVAATIPVGSSPGALAVDGKSVWVANQYSGTVSQIDARHDAVVSTVAVAAGPSSLLVLDGRIWVGTRAPARHTGGTLRLLKSSPITIDPALQLDLGPFQSDGLTRDGLVTYNHASGAAGSELVPDLAVALPLPSDHGTTYTFRLRPGIHYSNGEPLRAGDVRRALERLFRVGSPGSDYFRAIVGAARCSIHACDLSRGIVTDDAARTVTFHLSAADPGFLQKLTIGGLSSPIPPGTPWHPVRTPIPGTGPYCVLDASSREIRYARNPFFHEWSHAAQPAGNPDQIVMSFGSSPANEIRTIERGDADWSADGTPGELLGEVSTRHRGLVHVFDATGTDFLQLNTTLPPFDDVRVRRALSYAIDRALIVRHYGGPLAARPTCQLLPPGILGYRRYCPYTPKPGAAGSISSDFPRAQQLVAASGTRGDQVTLWATTDSGIIQHHLAGYTVDLLRRLGYKVGLRVVDPAYFDAHPDAFRTIQMTPPSWFDETPYNFFGQWLVCGTAYNHRWFCDRHVDKTVVAAQALESTDARTAGAQWAALDRYVTDTAAVIPLVNPRLVDLVSARVGNYQHNPVLGVIADQLTLR